MVNLRGGLLHFLHLFSYCTYCTLFRQVLNLRDGIFELLQFLLVPEFSEEVEGSLVGCERCFVLTRRRLDRAQPL